MVMIIILFTSKIKSLSSVESVNVKKGTTKNTKQIYETMPGGVTIYQHPFFPVY